MSRPSPRREPGQDPHLPFDELAVGHALSALEPDEQARFSQHLTSCSRCERALAEHDRTLAELAHGAPSVEPPASLIEGIRAGLRAEARGIGSVRWPSAELAPAPVELPAPVDLAKRQARRSVQVRHSHLLTSAAAVLALVLGLGGWNAALHRDNAERGARVETLAAAVQSLESPDTRTVRLASPAGEVKAVAVLQGEQLSLVLNGLEPNGDDTVYVLWGQTSYGDVRAVGTFDVSRSDLDVRHGLRLEPGVGELTTLMVTREQGRTAPALTTEQVLVSGAVQET